MMKITIITIVKEGDSKENDSKKRSEENTKQAKQIATMILK